MTEYTITLTAYECDAIDVILAKVRAARRPLTAQDLNEHDAQKLAELAPNDVRRVDYIL